MKLSISNNFFIISGDVTNLLSNKRLVISLKRYKTIIANDSIKVPYNENRKNETLTNLQNLFKKYKVSLTLSPEVEDINLLHKRDINLFLEFSNNAFKIKNNQFNTDHTLIEKFDNFKNILTKSLDRKLYPLQLLSSFHMAYTQNSCNFAVPGAGKTSIVYGAYAYMKSLPTNHPCHVDNLMVIGPLSSFAPWEDEYKQCFGKYVESVRLSGIPGQNKQERLKHLYSAQPAELTLIFHGGVASLHNEIRDFLRNNKTMLVVDEAHKIKNPEGVWGKNIVDISQNAVSRIVLTGTPIPNGYEDLFNLFRFIYPFQYKDILKFQYTTLKGFSQSPELNSDKINQLKKNIDPFYIRIKKSDLNLPPIKEIIVNIDMDSFQENIYKTISNKYISLFIKKPTAKLKDFLNKARLIRMRQASTNPALLLRPLFKTLEDEDVFSKDTQKQLTNSDVNYLSESILYNSIKEYNKNHIPAKFKTLLDIVSRIRKEGEKVIIWTVFVENAKTIKKYLSKNGIKSHLLIGETPQEERELIIKSFNGNEQNVNVVIANPFAVAESISLHKGCHTAIYFERDYNAANFIQSKDRIHRVGLPPNIITTYYYLVSNNTIDEIINNRLQQKVKRMEEIIDEDIPLFRSIDDEDETDIIYDLIKQYGTENK